MLLFVPTPLGNLRDITLRALDELRDCDLIVAEDTRVARRLLAGLDLPSKPLRSYREHNAGDATQDILTIAADRRVAVVTDAGMPGISDPGIALVAAARAAGIAVEVLPGPCAFVTAAVLSGFAHDALTFAGFLPRRNGDRRTVFSRALEGRGITVFYESPHRIVESLAVLAELAPAANVFVGRELTKKFEQHIVGKPSDVSDALEKPVRGEIVLVVAGAADDRPHVPTAIDASSFVSQLEAALADGATPSVAAKQLARAGHGERSAVYRRIVEHIAATRARAEVARK